MNPVRPVLWACLLIAVLGSLVLSGCVPPSEIRTRSGCFVLQPLTQPVPIQARVRVRMAERDSATLAALLAQADVAESWEDIRSLTPSSGLVEPLIQELATSEALLLEVVGWPELKAYRSYQDSQREEQDKTNWEFGSGNEAAAPRVDLQSLVDPADWESCPYEVVADLVDYKYENVPIYRSTHDYQTSMWVESATAHIILVDRASARTLLEVNIPVSGNDILKKAARNFAHELERQIWQAKEGKPYPGDRL